MLVMRKPTCEKCGEKIEEHQGVNITKYHDPTYDYIEMRGQVELGAFKINKVIFYHTECWEELDVE